MATMLNFDDGFQEVTINNDPTRKIRWNPTDVNFVDKFITFQRWVENDFKTKVESMGISGKSFDEYDQGSITQLGTEMCEAINTTFGRDVSTAAFQGVNPISPMSNGNLLFANFIEALMPIIEESITGFENARRKYTDAATSLNPTS